MPPTSQRYKRPALEVDISDQKIAKILKLGETESVTELLLSFFQQHFSDEITTLEHCIKSKHLKVMDLQEIIRNKDMEIESLTRFCIENNARFAGQKVEN